MSITLNDEVKQKVLRQVEFYFSDSNLPKDRFLRQQVTTHPEGYVDLSLVVSFSRMREHLNLGNKRPEEIQDAMVMAVADVLRGSSALTVSEDGFQVKRAAPLADMAEVSKAVDSRSVYARPFPMDASLDDIQNFFRAVAPVNAVRLRRHATSKDFKGSVFVEFGSEADVEKALAQPLVFQGAPLRLQKKPEYLQRKKDERRAKGGAHGHDHHEDIETDDEIPAIVATNAEFAKADAMMEEAAPKPAPASAATPSGEVDEDAVPSFAAGCLLAFQLHDRGTEHVTFPLLKSAFGGSEKGVLYVDLTDNKQSGVVKFDTPEQAAAALAEFQGNPEADQVLAGVKASVKILEGDEEVAWHKSNAARRREAEARKGGPGGRGGGRGDGDYGGKRKFDGGRGGRGGGRRGGRGGAKRGRGN